MTSFKPLAALLALCCSLPPSIATAADEVAELRAELLAMKSEYAARVGTLEARIEQLESAPAPMPAQPAPHRPAVRDPRRPPSIRQCP